MILSVKSDSQIKDEVLRALKWDSRVDEAEIGVVVRDRTVTLMGATTSYAEKLAAEEAAHRIPGVLDVADQMQVRVPGGLPPTDTEIARVVRRALKAGAVPDERIESTVANGWVTLEGYVDVPGDGDEVARAVQRLRGVRGVINKLVIGGPGVDRRDVRDRIEEALAARARCAADQVHVRVRDAVVILSGKVDSWSEKRVVLEAVSRMPGVHTVRDALEIDPYSSRTTTRSSEWTRYGT